jgi:hypothetical protein
MKLIDTIVECEPGAPAPGTAFFRFRLFDVPSRLEIGLLTEIENEADGPGLDPAARPVYERLLALGAIRRNTPLIRHWPGALDRGWPPQFAFLLVTRDGEVDFRGVSLPTVIQLLSCGPDELLSSITEYPALSAQLAKLRRRSGEQLRIAR